MLQRGREGGEWVVCVPKDALAEHDVYISNMNWNKEMGDFLYYKLCIIRVKQKGGWGWKRGRREDVMRKKWWEDRWRKGKDDAKEEKKEEDAAEWKGKARERVNQTRLHSWEMRMVTMATAAESHMMRRSEREREGWVRAGKKKERQSKRVGCASRRQGRREEKRNGNEMKQQGGGIDILREEEK